MFRSKCRDPFKPDSLSLFTYSISDRKDPGIEYTDNIAGICFINNRSLLSHQLLRLCKTEHLIALNVEILLITLKLSRTDPHEGYPVSVRLVHVSLDLEDESRKIIVKRVYKLALCKSRQRRHRHGEEILQKRFYSEVVERRTEKDGAQFSFSDLVYIKLITCAVKKLNVVCQGSPEVFPDKSIKGFRIIQ